MEEALKLHTSKEQKLRGESTADIESLYENTDGQGQWLLLPEHVLICAFTYLGYSDRACAARVCKAWNEAFNSQYLWCRFTFYFHAPQHEKFINCVEYHGCHLKHIVIDLDQAVAENRTNACNVISKYAAQTERRLQSLVIRFRGENPCFYFGKEFISALVVLFSPPLEHISIIQPLQHLDLRGLTVAYDDTLFDTLSENHTQLKYLDIQNEVLVCRVSPSCLLRLVQRCRNLQDLRIFKFSAGEDVLLALIEDKRHPLQHLSLACRREEKYVVNIESETWAAVVSKLPDLRVTLRFDHTCPLFKIQSVMKQEVPLSVLRMETFTYNYQEIRLAASYYSKTLEKVIICTPMSRRCREMDGALLELSKFCKRLSVLHVFASLDQETIDTILSEHPSMQETGSYTLKTPGELADLDILLDDL